MNTPNRFSISLSLVIILVTLLGLCTSCETAEQPLPARETNTIVSIEFETPADRPGMVLVAVEGLTVKAIEVEEGMEEITFLVVDYPGYEIKFINCPYYGTLYAGYYESTVSIPFNDYKESNYSVHFNLW